MCPISMVWLEDKIIRENSSQNYTALEKKDPIGPDKARMRVTFKKRSHQRQHCTMEWCIKTKTDVLLTKQSISAIGSQWTSQHSPHWSIHYE